MRSTESGGSPPTTSKGSNGLLRLSGVLAFLGLLAYGLMLAGFAYEDRSLLEGVGAAGSFLVAFAILIATIGFTRRRSPGP